MRNGVVYQGIPDREPTARHGKIAPRPDSGLNLNDTNTRISICINSDVFVRGLCALLKETDESHLSINVIAPTLNGNAVDLDCDLLILDNQLAPTILPRLSHLNSPPRTILVSEQQHIGQKMAAEQSLACGFFPARAPERKLKKYLQVLLECTRQGPCEKSCKTCPLFASRRPLELPLTRRETDVFRLIGELHSTGEIAELLNVSIKTIESHCANIKHKLGLASSRELLKAASDWVEGR
jgi:DNA-binding CsgD family transcriptional regulator